MTIEEFDMGHTTGESDQRTKSEGSLSCECIATLFDKNLRLVASSTGHDALLATVVVLLNDLSIFFASIGDHCVLIGVGAEGEGWGHETLAVVYFLSDFDYFSHFYL